MNAGDERTGPAGNGTGSNAHNNGDAAILHQIRRWLALLGYAILLLVVVWVVGVIA